MIRDLRRHLTGNRGDMRGMIVLAAATVAGLGLIYTAVVNNANQSSAAATQTQLAEAVESRAQEYAAQLDSSLATPVVPPAGKVCSVSPAICTTVTSDIISTDGSSRTLRIEADQLTGQQMVMTRDVTLDATTATHVTSLDAHGRPTWASANEGHVFTIWGVASGSTTVVTPAQMQGPTGGTSWVNSTPGGGIDSAAAAWTFGPNTTCQTGQPVSGTLIAPTKITAITDARSVTTGAGSTFIMDALGRVWASGANNAGQLGLGNTTQSCTPTQIPGARFTTIVTANGSTFALDLSGNLYATGTNTAGQLGTGNTTAVTSFTQIAVGTHFTTLATSGATTYAIAWDGRLWSWGANDSGQLATGTTTAQAVPALVSNVTTKFVSIAAGLKNGYGIDQTGQLWGWGINALNQVGDGTTTQRLSPVKVTPGSVMTAITAGKNRGFATDQYGQVWAWGVDSAGELGLPTAATIAQPTKVTGLAHTRNVSSSLDTSSTAVVDTDGLLWSLGNSGGGLWASSVSGSPNAPLRMPRPDGFTAPTWQ